MWPSLSISDTNWKPSRKNMMNKTIKLKSVEKDLLKYNLHTTKHSEKLIGHLISITELTHLKQKQWLLESLNKRNIILSNTSCYAGIMLANYYTDSTGNNYQFLLITETMIIMTIQCKYSDMMGVEDEKLHSQPLYTPVFKLYVRT